MFLRQIILGWCAHTCSLVIFQLTLIFTIFLTVMARGQKPSSSYNLRFERINDQCVFDRETGLYWELKTSDSGIRDWRKTFTWYDPYQDKNEVGTKGQDTFSFVRSINGSGYAQPYSDRVEKFPGLCGFHDWRVPSVAELLSIRIAQVFPLSDPHVDLGVFRYSSADFYWTKENSNHPQKANAVNFGDGTVEQSLKKSDRAAIRLVRGTSSIERLRVPGKTDFTIAVLPDTQGYYGRDANVFPTMMRWISNNLSSQKIKFVTHVGDITATNKPSEWAHAWSSFKHIHGKVPYGLAVGNHDYREYDSDGNAITLSDSTLFQETFSASKFANFSWYGGSFKNNSNNYQLFRAEGQDYLVLHLECNAPDDVLSWADQILSKHSTRKTIITTHHFLGPIGPKVSGEDYYSQPKGQMEWSKCHGSRGNSPKQIWEKLIQKHKQVFLILCGDQSTTQAMYRSDKGVHGNRVHQILTDIRDGCLLLLRISPSSNKLGVVTYSPHLERLCTGTSLVPYFERHRFSVSLE